MNSPAGKNIFLAFIIVSIFNILGVGFELRWLILLTKPLLIPILLLAAVTGRSYLPKRKLLFGGLAFSFLGDVFLLFDKEIPLFFICGLLSFLVAHVFYIFFLLNIPSSAGSYFKQHKWLLPIVPVYVLLLLFVLFPGLGALKIPVLLYALVLGSMLFTAIHVKLRAGIPAGNLFICGAVFFVLSDSLLAINKFYQPFPLAGIFIMLSYCVTQFLIVKGFLAVKH